MLYGFGHCDLDMERFELRRAGRRETLEPRVLELLAYLIANRDRVVTRQELNEHVWRGRVVTDAAMNSCIKAARAHRRRRQDPDPDPHRTSQGLPVRRRRHGTEYCFPK
ncbi:MAG: winged helix-turn-helix domain-containing protein [Steroidobacteraceae bacterium]|nr:winged helix-turn-helix domain-containing protein [Steroidobacteraceae bacterium]